MQQQLHQLPFRNKVLLGTQVETPPNNQQRVAVYFLLSLLALLFLMGSSNAVFGQDTPVSGAYAEEGLTMPTVTTDKDDYLPGDVVIITGEGWQAGERVKLDIDHSKVSHGNTVLYATADDSGQIYNAEYLIQQIHLGEEFLLIATGLSSGLTAQTIFTDGTLFIATSVQSPNPVCRGSSATYTVNVSENESGKWEVSYNNTVTLSVSGLPTGASLGGFSPNQLFFDDKETISSILTVNTSNAIVPGTYPFTVRATSSNPTRFLAFDRTFSLVVTNPVTPSVSIAVTSGNSTICSGTGVTFTATPTNGGTTPSYQWKKDGSDVGSNSATYTDAGTTPGNISVVMTSGLSCVTQATATSNPIAISINPPAPATPVTLAESNTTCTSFTANWNASANATSYLLDVSTNPNFNNFLPGYNNVNIGNVTSVDLTGLSAGTPYYYRVRASNSCGTSTSSSDSYTTATIPAQPGTISGLTSVCSGATDITYSIGAVNGATSYTWTLPNGWTGTSATNSITVAAGSSAVSGNISVTANNICGNSPARTLAVTVNNIPSTPGAITGTAAVCPGSTGNSYAVTAVSSATSYTWTVPSGWTITAGATTRAITVTATNAVEAGNVTVTASNSCGTSEARSFEVTVSPGTPSSPVAVEATNGTCTSFTANWNASANATTYFLDVSKNASFSNLLINNQNIGNLTSYQVSGLEAGDDYFYRVRASNSCGTSASSNEIAVIIPKTPATPGTITGINTVCSGTTGVTYSIAAVSGATTYTWTVPAGWSITGGQGTTSVTVTAGTSGGNISVTAGNTCGTSSARSLSISVTPTPTTANAGPNQLNAVGTSTTLAGNTPTVGTGTWTILNGAGGSFGVAPAATSTSTNPSATFKGTIGVTYTLRWTIANGSCTSYDEVQVLFNQIITNTTTTSPTVIYGSTSVTLSATVSPNPGAGSVDFYINNSKVGTGTVGAGGVATYNYNPSSLNAATYTLKAQFAASGFYTTSSGNGSLKVEKAPTNTVVTVSNGTYNGSAQGGSAEVTGAGGLEQALAVSYAGTGTTTYGPSATAPTNVGSYSVTASYAESTNYLASNDTKTFTISQATLTVTAADKTREYGEANPGLTGTITGIKNGDKITATYATTATQASEVGTYAIVPSVTGEALSNYEVTKNNGTLTITKATLIVTADDKTRVYGEANPTLTGSITGEKNGESFTATYATTAVATSKVGDYAITVDEVTGATLANYEVVEKAGTLTITKATLVVTADDKTRVYGEANPIFTASYSGFKNSQTFTTSGVSGAPSLTTTAVAISKVDDYDILAAIGSLAADNYQFSFEKGTLAITKATLVVTTENATKVYGERNPVFTVSYEGFVNGDNAGKLSGTLGFTTNATSTSSVGDYDVIPEGLTSANYAITFEKGTLIITKRLITITPDAISKVYGEEDPSFTYTTSEALLPGNSFSGALGRTSGNNVDQYNYNLGNLSAGNSYNLSLGGNNKFTITPKELTGSFTAANKVYNGNTLATITERSLTGVVGNDAVSLSGGTATFADKNVGTGKIVTLVDATLAGASGNYSLSSAAITTTADITPRSLVVSATGINKVYDGTTAATVNLSDNRLSDEVLTASYTSATFEGPNVGTSKLVNVTGISLSGTDAGNYALANTSTTTTANITVATTTTTLITSAGLVRFMDNLTMTAQIKPLNIGSPLTGTVEFKIGDVSYGKATVVPVQGASDGLVQATLIKQVSNLPANYTVTTVFTSTNSNYSGSTANKSLEVRQRNANPRNVNGGFYAGDVFAWTTSSSSSKATVTLIASLKDNNLPGGDLRAAKVTFYYVNGTTLTPIPSAKDLPVGLVDVNDGTVGFASAIVQFDIGSNNAQNYQVAVGVSGAYTNSPNASLAQTIITVSKPVPGGFIVGGSQLTNILSSGYIKGHKDMYTDYQFDIQYTKSGSNPKGKAKVVVRSYYKPDGTLDDKQHTYWITTNAVATLNVTKNNDGSAVGNFSAKANLDEYIFDGTTARIVPIEGGATFQMEAYQKQCDQQIAITLFRKAGGIWFSSRWDGGKTVRQAVNSTSRVFVEGGGTTACSPTSTARTSSAPAATSELTDLTVSPNPFQDRVIVDLGSETEGDVILTLTDTKGAVLLKKVVKSESLDGTKFELVLPTVNSGLYYLQVVTGKSSKIVKLVKD